MRSFFNLQHLSGDTITSCILNWHNQQKICLRIMQAEVWFVNYHEIPLSDDGISKEGPAEMVISKIRSDEADLM
jgi:hypothetical protein